MKRLPAIILACAALLAWIGPAHFSPLLACPNCKESIAANGGGYITGFNQSIVFMLVLVGAMGSLISGLVYWVVRSESPRGYQREGPASLTAHSAGHPMGQAGAKNDGAGR